MYIAQTRLLVVGQHRKVFTRFAKGWNSCLFVKKKYRAQFLQQAGSNRRRPGMETGTVAGR